MNSEYQTPPPPPPHPDPCLSFFVWLILSEVDSYGIWKFPSPNTNISTVIIILWNLCTLNVCWVACLREVGGKNSLKFFMYCVYSDHFKPEGTVWSVPLLKLVILTIILWYIKGVTILRTEIERKVFFIYILKQLHVLHLYHTGKCIRRFGGIYAYCRYFIDRKW